MVDMSNITAVETAEKERDAALGKLKAEKRRIEVAGKVHKEEVSKINTKFRNQIKKLKKELDFWRIASGVLLIVSITLVYQLISPFI